MRPALASFLTVLLLWALLTQANHYLAGNQLYLFVGGLLVVHAALELPLRSGMAVSMLIGAICDANAPGYLGTTGAQPLVPFGTEILLFATVHALLFNLRDRLPHEETTGRVVIALFANLALFLALSFIEIDHSPAPGTSWLRLFVDLIFSQIVLALIAPWFFALQRRATALAQPAPAWR
jgi:rod shape-determining protein MreD